MKGKKLFTKDEAVEIRRLLKEKVDSRKNKKKNVRGKIRKIGFYISDFRSKKEEFTLDDFDELVKNKKVKII